MERAEQTLSSPFIMGEKKWLGVPSWVIVWY